jgi:uncharacterized protein YjbI with pentapeptide repeats
MGNVDPIKILRQGTAAWNKWWEENPDEDINLSGAALTGANLSKAVLVETNLEKATLTGCKIYAPFAGKY